MFGKNTVVQKACKNISVYYQNVRGLRSKTTELFQSVSICNYDILCLTETNLGKDVFDSELFGPEYVVLRSDRNLALSGLAGGGGVLIAVRRPLSVRRLSVLDDALLDFAANASAVGGVITGGNKTVHIIVVYIRPAQTVPFYTSFFDMLGSCDFTSEILIVGDFNIPEYIQFRDNHQIIGRTAPLLNFVSYTAAYQINEIRNLGNRILDLVLTNTRSQVQRAIEVLVPEDSYHPSLVILLSFDVDGGSQDFPNVIPEGSYNFKKADYLSLYTHLLSVDWDFLLEIADVDEACGSFYDVVFNIFDLYVPKMKFRRLRYPPWFTGGIIKKLRLKYRAWRRFKLYENQADRELFVSLRRQLKADINISYREYNYKNENSISVDPRNFWSAIGRKRGRTSGIPSVMISHGSPIKEIANIVQAFSDCFSESYVASSSGGIRFPRQLCGHSECGTLY